MFFQISWKVWRNMSHYPFSISNSFHLPIPSRNQVKEVHFDSLSVNVSAGSKGTCQIIVPRPNTVLSWSFLSQYYDIDFSVTAGEDGKETEIIVPPLRYSADVEHQGKIVVPKIGTYYLVWDNTSSWMRKRNVVYSYSLHFLDLDLDEKTLCSKF